MDREKIKGQIEAILFSSGRVVKPSELELSLELDLRIITDIINEMQEEYKKAERGIEIVKVNNRIYTFKQKRISRIYIWCNR